MPTLTPRRWTTAFPVATVLVALAAPPMIASDRPLSPAEARLKADVAYLADDLREGRAPGSRGIEAAADYVAGVFRELGLRSAPGAEGYFQPFVVRGSPSLGAGPTLAFKTKDQTLALAVQDDFAPLALGATAAIDGAPVVFAGYGITAKDAETKLDYDDYAGIDVKDKVVLILRREPRQDDPNSPFDGRRLSNHADLRTKATAAFQHGAKAILLVNDTRSAGDHDFLLPLAYTGGDQTTSIPFLMITREKAEAILKAGGLPGLDALEREIDSDFKPRSKPLDAVSVSARYAINREEIATKNVVAVLEGAGPLAEETIVVGGHYDHLGRGGLTSGSLAPLSRDIHNGADDNASGTAMVLEMARRLARRPDPPARRVVFLAFSGEEKGLLGSKYYVNNPLYPLDKTVFMINFDMVGRLNDRDELTFFGVGSTPGATELVDALGASLGFKIKKVKGMSDGIGGSDHESFYLKKIPVLFAFTGVHTQYHRPSDDAHLVNVAGMARIADLGELLLLDLIRRPQRPEFTRSIAQAAAPAAPADAHAEAPANPHGGTPPPAAPASDKGTTDKAAAKGAADDPARVSIRAYLGSIPDYDDSVSGVKLAGVNEGSPAEKGGLKGGDIVVGFGGKPVATIYDYTNSLAAVKPGETVEVKVKRDGKEVVLKVTLGSRSSGR